MTTRTLSEPPTQQNPVKTVQQAIPPSPHGRTSRIPRPQNVAYTEALQQERAKEEGQAKGSQEHISEGGVLKLAQALTHDNSPFTLHKWGRKDKHSEETESDNEKNAENDKQHQDKDKESHHEDDTDPDKDQTKEREKYNGQDNALDSGKDPDKEKDMPGDQKRDNDTEQPNDLPIPCPEDQSWTDTRKRDKRTKRERQENTSYLRRRHRRRRTRRRTRQWPSCSRASIWTVKASETRRQQSGNSRNNNEPEQGMTQTDTNTTRMTTKRW